ncbi:hypothetical protein ODR14_21910, partial [Escherichia coli]|nr:hypothetical protein [Escherichia coli]
ALLGVTSPDGWLCAIITERLVQALGLVDIRVPDHLIVGGSQVFSFAEHGLL